MQRLLLLLLLPLLGCPSPGDDDDSGADDDDVANDDDDATEGCWQAAALLDVASAPGPGGDYPMPTLSGRCEGDDFIIESNQIPHYTFVPMTPNALAAQEITWTLPRQPALNAQPTPMPLLGYAGYTVGGTPVYGPNEGPFPDPYGDPVYNAIVDPCQGHTAAQYHNHALVQKCLTPDALVAEPWTLPDPDPTVPSPILGFAADGFPIYGPYGCLDADCTQVVEFRSGWVQTGDPTTYAWWNHEYQASDDDAVLDECNGRVGPDGTYRYHATSGFPYVIGCYMGTPVGTAGQTTPGPSPDGGDDDDDMGPPSCDGPDDDCTGQCPDGAFGCTCATTPNGDACIPTCTQDSHCAGLVGGPPLTCDEVQGLCVPTGGP
jgi:hypothetical protein